MSHGNIYLHMYVEPSHRYKMPTYKIEKQYILPHEQNRI